MQVRFRGQGADGSDDDVELDLTVRRPDAVVDDLRATLVGGRVADGGSGLLVDGRLVAGDLGLDEAGIVHGSTISLPPAKAGGSIAGTAKPTARSAVDASAVGGGREVVITGGLHAGGRWALGRVPLIVGRRHATAANLVEVGGSTVSPTHFTIEPHADHWRVRDLGSHNGVWVGDEPVREQRAVAEGDLIRFGAAEARLRRTVTADRPAGLEPSRMAVGGLIAFNRPPRAALDAGPGCISVPDPPMAAKRHPAFSVAAMIGPIVMGVVMVQVLGSMRYGLVALMGPVMLITNHVAGRRRAAKESKSSTRRFRSDLTGFRADLAAAVAAERERRESEAPDPPEISRRASLPSSRLWERRPTDDDFLRLRVGRGPVAWTPPADPARVAGHADLREATDQASTIPHAPVTVDLAAGNVVGLVGDRSAALALARSLVVQAAVLHGPADLSLMVLVDRRTAPDWDWTKWLPHVRSAAGSGRFLSADTVASAALMQQLLDAREPSAPRSPAVGPVVFVVVDDEALLHGRRSPTRSVLRGAAGPATGIVLAPTVDRLPGMCTAVVHLLDDLGDAEVVRPQAAARVTGVAVAGMGDRVARECARAIARFEDPELGASGAGLPATVRLLDLLALPATDAAALARAIAERWRAGGSTPRVPIGVAEDGTFELDLVEDGPHALIAGTTGSGKSELLRSIVVGLAAELGPAELVFVLVDYKGGSAFDACARLPHTVGLVTDLDEHLGERALRSLEAELHHRERTLRGAGATDLTDYSRLGSPGGPLPRLLVVVDEFATMAAELPDFIGSLVGIAQRGRSLGVHMILATQRPSGAVNANIRANTNIRIALRVQDAHDSADVIERPDASGIPRSRPGRAFVRLGPADVQLVQSALATGTSTEPREAIEARPFRFGPAPSEVTPPTGDGPSDLTRLVDACVDAFSAAAIPAPRRPWLEMLEAQIPLDAVDRPDRPSSRPGDLVVPFGLADDPDHQRRRLVEWDPGAGHLGLFGAVGSGTTTALSVVALAAARRHRADDLHVYALDFGGGGLASLADLPQVGAVIGPAERERQVRLVEVVHADMVRRRDLDPETRDAEPRIVVVIDGLPAFLADFEDAEGQTVLDSVKRILADGPGVGISVAFSADRPTAVPMRLMGAVGHRVLFRHADPADFATIGVRPRQLPSFVPGRAIDATSGLVLQVPFVEDVGAVIAEETARAVTPRRPPLAIEALPSSVAFATVAPAVEVGATLRLPLGVGGAEHSVVGLDLWPGDHVFIAGRARSGVTTMLRTVARLLALADPEAVMVAVIPERSPVRADADRFDGVGTVEELQRVLEVAARGDGRDWVIVVDDAHLIDDPGALERVAKAGERCRLVLGGRADQLRGKFNHWSRHVRRSGTGFLLQPVLDADGDLLGVRLPRRVPAPLPPGRGFVVERGAITLVHAASVEATVPEGLRSGPPAQGAVA